MLINYSVKFLNSQFSNFETESPFLGQTRLSLFAPEISLICKPVHLLFSEHSNIYLQEESIYEPVRGSEKPDSENPWRLSSIGSSVEDATLQWNQGPPQGSNAWIPSYQRHCKNPKTGGTLANHDWCEIMGKFVVSVKHIGRTSMRRGRGPFTLPMSLGAVAD